MLNAFRRKNNHTPADIQERVPPGQHLTDKFPVLLYGDVPRYQNVTDTWDLRVWGAIAKPRTFSYTEFRALPTVDVVTDIHCVTRWSKLDTQWQGVRFRDFLAMLPPLNDGVTHVMAHCEYGFTANVPLEYLMFDDALLAYKYDGEELTPDHGYPLRLLTPKKYFWKSAKWLRGLEFMTADRLGFWERYGYNNNADPWLEERYSD